MCAPRAPPTDSLDKPQDVVVRPPLLQRHHHLRLPPQPLGLLAEVEGPHGLHGDELVGALAAGEEDAHTPLVVGQPCVEPARDRGENGAGEGRLVRISPSMRRQRRTNDVSTARRGSSADSAARGNKDAHLADLSHARHGAAIQRLRELLLLIFRSDSTPDSRICPDDAALRLGAARPPHAPVLLPEGLVIPQSVQAPLNQRIRAWCIRRARDVRRACGGTVLLHLCPSKNKCDVTGMSAQVLE
jgi:hypothetical protein